RGEECWDKARRYKNGGRSKLRRRESGVKPPHSKRSAQPLLGKSRSLTAVRDKLTPACRGQARDRVRDDRAQQAAPSQGKRAGDTGATKWRPKQASAQRKRRQAAALQKVRAQQCCAPTKESEKANRDFLPSFRCVGNDRDPLN